MTQVSLSMLKVNAGKYVSMAEDDEEVFITRNGKIVAKIVSAKVDKKEAFKHFLSLFPEKGLDLDPEKAREERIG